MELLTEAIDPAPYLAQLDDVRVKKVCGCGDDGCETVVFELDRDDPSEEDMIADASGPEGQLVMVFTALDGRLSMLEVI